MPSDVDVQALLSEALAYPPERRQAFVEKRCRHDLAALGAASALLRESDDSDPFLNPGGAMQGPLWEEILGGLASSHDPGPVEAPAATWPDAPGYRIERVLGEGGMGVVYLAEQVGALRRRVALKVIKVGVISAAVLRRFELERQALARMEHPNIARVFEAGATSDGTPYVAMEYVPGEPITSYCNRSRCDIRTRIELVVNVCDAVQHAHQKGIIHRDLKPSNVLVAQQEGSAVPKVIDFGIAKPTAELASQQTVFTRLGQIVGTLEYMSPEQATPSLGDVDTRADVYSLGMLLYELLAGALPFTIDEGHPIAAWASAVAAADFLTPSERVRTLKAKAEAAARERQSDVRSLTRRLRGDLDWIVMKALQKDRTRRYASASDLSADLRRELRHEPVTAGPPHAAYRARKFVRRHTAAVAIAVAAIVALVTGAGAAAIGLLEAQQAEGRAREAEVRARDEALVASRITDFLVGLFRVSDPGSARGNTVTVREILDRGSTQIRSELSEQPLMRVRLLETMAEVYQNLGVIDVAASMLEEVVQQRKANLLTDRAGRAASLNELARIYYRQARYQEADVLAGEALALAEATAPASLQVAQIIGTQAVLRAATSRPAEAEPLHKRAIETAKRAVGSAHTEVAALMEPLGDLYITLGRHGEAASLYEQTLEINTRSFGRDHPSAINSLVNLGKAYNVSGQYHQATTVLEEALRLQERVLGPRHLRLGTTLMNLFAIQLAQGRYDLAEPLAQRNLDIMEAALGPGHPNVAMAHANVGSLYHKLGRFREAEAATMRAIDILETAVGPDDPRLAVSLSNLSATAHELKQLDRAEALQKRAIDIRRKALGAQHPDLAWSLRGLGIIYQHTRRYAEAEEQFRLVVEIREAALGPHHADLGTALNSLGEILLKRGRLDEAARRFERAATILEASAGDVSPDLASSFHGLALVRFRQKQYGESESLFKRSLAIMNIKHPANHPTLLEIRRDYDRLLHATGRVAPQTTGQD